MSKISASRSASRSVSKRASASRREIELSAHRKNLVAANVLSHLAAEHGTGKGITGFFSPEELAELRLVSTGFKEAVGRAPINDVTKIVKGSLSGWRRSFPNAKAINISDRDDLTNADFVHLKGLETVIMDWCSLASVTNEAFENLKGIKMLSMKLSTNNQHITDAAFEHLKGIRNLNIYRCTELGITDEAFEHLKGIHTLDMSVCDQEGITDAAFVHLKGIHTLYMEYCNQAGITDAAFVHLEGIHELDMMDCNQVTITDAAFFHLKGIDRLIMRDCNQLGITDAAFVHLKGIKMLDITGCTQPGITATGSLCDLHGATIVGKQLTCATRGARGGKGKTRSNRRKGTKKAAKRR